MRNHNLENRISIAVCWLIVVASFTYLIFFSTPDHVGMTFRNIIKLAITLGIITPPALIAIFGKKKHEDPIYYRWIIALLIPVSIIAAWIAWLGFRPWP
jgi:hypothetical protein